MAICPIALGILENGIKKPSTSQHRGLQKAPCGFQFCKGMSEEKKILYIFMNMQEFIRYLHNL